MDKPKLHHSHQTFSSFGLVAQIYRQLIELPVSLLCFRYSFCCSSIQSEKVNIASAQEVEDSTEVIEPFIVGQVRTNCMVGWWWVGAVLEAW